MVGQQKIDGGGKLPKPLQRKVEGKNGGKRRKKYEPLWRPRGGGCPGISGSTTKKIHIMYTFMITKEAHKTFYYGLSNTHVVWATKNVINGSRDHRGHRRKPMWRELLVPKLQVVQVHSMEYILFLVIGQHIPKKFFISGCIISMKVKWANASKVWANMLVKCQINTKWV